MTIHLGHRVSICVKIKLGGISNSKGVEGNFYPLNSLFGYTHFARFLFLRYTAVMSKESLVFTLGLLLLIIPHLGLPEEWKVYFFFISGVLLVLAGYRLRRAAYLRSIEKEHGVLSTDSFVEHASKPTINTRI
jgi:hypothetical protein